jgi:hypothetical protein
LVAPASFRAGIQQAVAILAAAISDKITVNIKIDYSGTGGAAAADCATTGSLCVISRRYSRSVALPSR